ncbi:aspartate kinase [Chlamydiifrater phoenicopteri]|uniref:aspartate kinase n=1 Tax=Chlamydiifrater phoenicopteri TaxID=2681469 RepID=UPI001BCF1A47|nr:aspartate kinase [Chlamydiifrater phoenicopteri]
MSRVVVKFGGGSIRSVKSIRKVAEIIRGTPEAEVIVVSAFAGVTNMLSDLFVLSNKDRRLLLDKILLLHEQIASELRVPFFSNFFRNKIRDNLFCDGGVHPRKKAEVLSVGEDMSQAILANFFIKMGICTETLCARTLIITDAKYEKASPDLYAMRRLWSKRKSLPGVHYLIQGFLGATEHGETTLLGRGGSDYTAALVAEMIKADEVRLYKDVAGVYSVDPGYSSRAEVLSRLSFQEMEALSHRGAKVVYPPTLLPCMRANIPIRVLSTFDEDPTELLNKGTLISYEKGCLSSSTDTFDSRIRALAIRTRLVIVFIHLKKHEDKFKVHNFLETLSQKCFLDYMQHDDKSYAVVLEEIWFNRFCSRHRVFQKLASFADLNIIKNVSTLSLVGRGLSNLDYLSDAVRKLLQNVVSVVVLYQVGDTAFTVVVGDDEAFLTASLLHDELVRETSLV